jgi:hypothetical protein
MGNLPIVIIPAICNEKGGPFGARDVCHSNALSYASFSMAVRHHHPIRIYSLKSNIFNDLTVIID